MVRHALGPEDKSARRAVILDAARGLFAAGDGGLPSAAEIATAAGLAKGTVYLYFRTKEEIFVGLLLEELQILLSTAVATFRTSTGPVPQRVAAFLQSYCDCVQRQPEVLRLDAIGYSVLEKNIDADKLREFKGVFVEHLLEAGAAMEKALDLAPGRGTTLLMRTFALTRGLWQTSNPCDPLDQNPATAMLHPEFYGELMEALTEYWRGAVLQP